MSWRGVPSRCRTNKVPDLDKPILYTQTGCADSAKVRAWLTEQGTAFTERAVSDDLNAVQALYATGVFVTPLVVVGDAKLSPESLLLVCLLDSKTMMLGGRARFLHPYQRILRSATYTPRLPLDPP